MEHGKKSKPKKISLNDQVEHAPAMPDYAYGLSPFPPPGMAGYGMNVPWPPAVPPGYPMWMGMQGQAAVPDYSSSSGRREKGNQRMPDRPTTIQFRNVPNGYSRGKILELLDASGFCNLYDFIYVPHDFKRLPAMVNLGYFFVNFTSHEAALNAFQKLMGFKDWTMDSNKVLTASWATETQGQKACVRRYKNCPVMHETVPSDCKPMILDNGVMINLAPSKKNIKQPRFKMGALDDEGGKGDGDDPGAPDEPYTYYDSDADGADQGVDPEIPRQVSVVSYDPPADDDTDDEFAGRPSQSSNTAAVWMPDSSVDSCSKCNEKFTLLRRRHHCRACGLVCCAQCAPRTNKNWSKMFKRDDGTIPKRLCIDCSQLPEGEAAVATPSGTEGKLRVKKTFIDVKEQSMGFDQQAADSLPF